MREDAGSALTAAVRRSLAGTTDPRLRFVMDRLIDHLHAFIRETELTEAEWLRAIQFLSATGQISDDRRQEFILLSDVLGVSMLVDEINHPAGGPVTASTVLGPFYRPGARDLPLGASISQDGRGEPAVFSGRVLAPGGTPIPGALLDVWETNENGLYEQQDPDQPDMNLRGRFQTDAAGRYTFTGIKPVSYAIPDDGPVGQLLRVLGRHPYRPAHVHFIVSAAGYRPTPLPLFVKGDPSHDSDAVFAIHDALVVDFIRHDTPAEAYARGFIAPFYTVTYDFVLQPLDNATAPSGNATWP